MSLENLFYTQLGGIIAFVVTLFILYRVLVSQKDATIQVLTEKCSYLECQLGTASKQQPDALAKSLSERVGNLNAEIQRLSEDKISNQGLITAKEHELEIVKEEADTLSRQISNAHELMSEYFCPTCKAPMAERAFHSELVEYGGRAIDIDHEFVSFECGLSLHDGEVSNQCENT